MSPAQSTRQLLVWSLPTVAVLLSLFWYRKRKNCVHSKSASIDPSTSTRISEPEKPEISTPKEIKKEKPKTLYSRSLSGVDSAPIDIKTPKSAPLVVSDKDLDIEIEKIKSMKSGMLNKSPEKQMSPNKKQSPVAKQMPANKKQPPIIKQEKQEQNKIEQDLQVKIEKLEKMSKKQMPAKKKQSPAIKKQTKAGKQQNEVKSKNPLVKITEAEADVNNKNLLNSEVKLETVDKNQTTTTSPKNQMKEIDAEVVSEAGEGSLNDRGRSVDRDSANHSPVEVFIPASPSLSNISDNHSDSDSGKGGSDVATPPPSQQQKPTIENAVLNDPDESEPEINIYEFLIPQNLVGRLIGRHGAFVRQIRERTNARILIKRHPDVESKLKICAIEGTSEEIDESLKLVREKFPNKRYPDLTFERISYVSVVPDCMYLRLVEGINNDTIVSCVVTPSHLFLQQPTHPTFPNLNILHDFMQNCYSIDLDEQNSPPLLDPINVGTICAGFSSGIWYRVSIISVDEEGTAQVQFLDYGGFASISSDCLRQIRGDFLLLPFQASECVLANVEPYDSEGWSQEAVDSVVSLTGGVVVFTQIVDYLEDGVTPLVQIYVRPNVENHRGLLLLNRVLVDRGFARWIENTTR